MGPHARKDSFLLDKNELPKKTSPTTWLLLSDWVTAVTQDKGLFPRAGEMYSFLLIMIFILSDISYALDIFYALFLILKTSPCL